MEGTSIGRVGRDVGRDSDQMGWTLIGRDGDWKGLRLEGLDLDGDRKGWM